MFGVPFLVSPDEMGRKYLWRPMVHVPHYTYSVHVRALRAISGVPPWAGPVHVEFFPIMVFYQNSPVSRSFELIYRVLKKNKKFAGTYPNVTVAGSTAASLGQRANVHTAVLSKCTHILAVLVK